MVVSPSHAPHVTSHTAHTRQFHTIMFVWLHPSFQPVACGNPLPLKVPASKSSCGSCFAQYGTLRHGLHFTTAVLSHHGCSPICSDATFTKNGAGAPPQPPTPPPPQQQPQIAMPTPALPPNRNLAEISEISSAEEEENVGATAAVETAGVGVEGQRGLLQASSNVGAFRSSLTSSTTYAEQHPAPPIKPRGHPLLEHRASHVHSYEVRHENRE